MVEGGTTSQACGDLDRARRRGIDLEAGKVPETILMAANAAGQIVGSSDIRHHLTDSLMHWGGHIGYVVVPEVRRLGCATEIRAKPCLGQGISASTLHG